MPNRGTLRRDLSAFLTSTFASADAATEELLRGLVVEAQLDPTFRKEFFDVFNESRRSALRAVFARAQELRELAKSFDIDFAHDLMDRVSPP